MQGPPGKRVTVAPEPHCSGLDPVQHTSRAFEHNATGAGRDFNPCPSCDQVSAAGRSQGIAFAFGRGRVVIIGEMGALVDYSVPGMQNRQFALNIVPLAESPTLMAARSVHPALAGVSRWHQSRSGSPLSGADEASADQPLAIAHAAA